MSLGTEQPVRIVLTYVVDVRRCDLDRMHKAAECIDPDVAFHAEPPFIALLRLVHFGIALLLRVLGGRRRVDDGGVYHSPTLEHLQKRE